ncbi:MAG: type II toxin-antitoxin system VapC family toxin [Gammaproteobacteria bacterium]|nr:type II toxin-antitoxin system VapC family toxin [Gammaproteobacteria bacterium]
MIAIDTNALVRYLVADHPEQSEAVRNVAQSLTAENPAYVCREVLVELVRVLERSYGFSREQIQRTLLEMHVTDEIVLETAEDVLWSATHYHTGAAGFSDLMIIAACRRADAPLYTFDPRVAARFDGVEVIPVREGKE